MSAILDFSQILHLVDALNQGDHGDCSTCKGISKKFTDVLAEDNPNGIQLISTKTTTKAVKDLTGALQWLLDDMHAADETHNSDGTIFDSVEMAARTLKEYGGNPPFELPDNKSYTEFLADEEWPYNR